MRAYLPLFAIGSVLVAGGCATAPAATDFASLQRSLDAKRAASTKVYSGVTLAAVQEAANAVLLGIDDGFAVSLTDDGIVAARGWSSYMVLANVVGWDYWVVNVRPIDGGTEVFVNATIRSRVPGLLEMAIPPANGLLAEIPLSSTEGLTVEEMQLFHRRLEAKLSGSSAWETCDTAFGGQKGDYPLTCNRGGVTRYL